MNHQKLHSVSAFRGFFLTRNRLKLFSDLSLDEFKQYGQNWGLSISEVSSNGEIHESTPIVVVTVIPRMMADKALKHNDLGIIREYERRTLGQVRIPDTNNPVKIDAKPFLI